MISNTSCTEGNQEKDEKTASNWNAQSFKNIMDSQFSIKLVKTIWQRTAAPPSPQLPREKALLTTPPEGMTEGKKIISEEGHTSTSTLT